MGSHLACDLLLLLPSSSSPWKRPQKLHGNRQEASLPMEAGEFPEKQKGHRKRWKLQANLMGSRDQLADDERIKVEVGVQQSRGPATPV